MRNVSQSILLAELGLAKGILDKWYKEVESGIPGEDFPAEEIDQRNSEAPKTADDFYEKLCGELLRKRGFVVEDSVLTLTVSPDDGAAATHRVRVVRAHASSVGAS